MAGVFMDFYLSPSGRVSVSQYWLNYILPIAALGGVLGFVGGLSKEPSVVLLPLLMVSPFLLWTGTVMSIKRLHDIGWTGWALFLSAIPIVGLIIPIIVWFVPGHFGDNQHGPDPRPWVPKFRTPRYSQY